MFNKKYYVERKVPLETEVDWLLRGLPQSDGGSKTEPAESWEGEEHALAQARHAADDKELRIEEIKAELRARRPDDGEE